MGTSHSIVPINEQLCGICSLDKGDIGMCDTCNKNVCEDCCGHKPPKENKLFNKKLDPVVVKNIKDEPKQKFKQVRHGTFMHNGKLSVLAAFYFQDTDSHRTCCNASVQWKMCFLDGSSDQIGKRMHEHETKQRFPGSMAASKTKKLTYITSPYKQKVYTINSFDAVFEAFRTDGQCFGIASFGNGLAITLNLETDFHTAKWQVQYLDFHGIVKKRIIYDKEGIPLFSEPWFLASNIKEDILFVSDFGKSSVVALSPKGNVLFKYTSSNLKQPLGLTVDMDNNIYVADGHTVVQIKAGGTDSNVLLDTKTPKNDVAAVCFEPTSMKLVVIQKCGKVSTFAFEV